ncbi:hypothetical protein HZ326_24422 [Fusarium oxysporum f. sp. albedinis]|nr:hypothetical protein HZ326_24422 [Fusarium oxysporum f. sp. albedinis]
MGNGINVCYMVFSNLSNLGLYPLGLILNKASLIQASLLKQAVDVFRSVGVAMLTYSSLHFIHKFRLFCFFAEASKVKSRPVVSESCFEDLLYLMAFTMSLDLPPSASIPTIPPFSRMPFGADAIQLPLHKTPQMLDPIEASNGVPAPRGQTHTLELVGRNDVPSYGSAAVPEASNHAEATRDDHFPDELLRLHEETERNASTGSRDSADMHPH